MQYFSKIELRNLLSFSTEFGEFELRTLNILIGANGSGKSNFLDAFSLLRSFSNGSTGDIFSQSGGIKEWIGKSRPKSPATISASIPNEDNYLRHTLSFQREERATRILSEVIENVKESSHTHFYDFNNGRPLIPSGNGKNPREMDRGSFDPNLSILSQRKDPENYPEITALSKYYSEIRLYRTWEFSRDSVLRNPQRTDLKSYTLEEDYSNFCLFLSRLFKFPIFKRNLITALKDIYSEITDIEINIEGSTAQIFIVEGDYSIPATRLSDGTLRYLTLLAILLDPDPPRFIGIEEPELGLHPDLISRIASLLTDASTRTQLLVTTHSELLVNAFSKDPESIVVCEKENGGTTLKRLEPERLKIWLEDYKHQLGDVWLRGELGGVRW